MVDVTVQRRGAAIILVSFAITMIMLAFMLAGYLLTIALAIPSRFDLPVGVRLIGVLVLGVGFLLLVWFFRHRKPVEVLVSTYLTFSKAWSGVPLENSSRRTEPLIVPGPYRYVRHPLYLAVFLLFLGTWLVLDHSQLIFSAFLLLLWFNFVVAPYEEKELVAIFGQQYREYAKRTPKIIPFTARSGED